MPARERYVKRGTEGAKDCRNARERGDLLEDPMKCLVVVSLLFTISGTAAGQDRGVIECQDRASITAWEQPESIMVARQLSCDQAVTILGVERGYVKIQVGQQIGYVDAKYVRILQAQEQRSVQPEKQDAKEIRQAQQNPGKTSTPKPLQQKPVPRIASRQTSQSDENEERGHGRHSFGLGFDVSHREYEEPGFMNDKGIMSGVFGDYTFHPGHFMFRLDGRLSLGNIDYWSKETGTAAGIRDYNLETRFSFGYSLMASEKTSFTPFMGFGYRYLLNGFGQRLTTTGATGYDRKSNYLYSPMGLETMFRLKPRWSLGLVGEYDLLWHGWQYSEIGDMVIDPYIPIVLPNLVLKNDQNHGWGARGSIKLIKNMRRIDFSVEPYFRYWDIKDSDLFELVVYPAYYSAREPANNTKEWGAKIGIRF